MRNSAGRIILLLAITLVAAYPWLQWSQRRDTGQGDNPPSTTAAIRFEDGVIEQAFGQRKSDFWVSQRGRIVRLLEDDNAGSRHQRFIVELESGHTLLIAHNIDLADRIPDLVIGELIEFHGEYAWNGKGGVIHWTHHDPKGRQQGGWIRYRGKTYE